MYLLEVLNLMIWEFFFSFFNILNAWWPWLTFWSDLWFVQFLLVYVLYLIFSTFNVFYVLLYLFSEIVLFGIFISIYQMELFTGFLWVAEGTVVFVALILLFYLNIDGLYLRLNLKLFKLYNSFWLFLLILVFSNFSFVLEYENYLPLAFNNIDLWDDYYEAFNNLCMNDFYVLTISYYSVNSFELLLIGLLLLIGSVVCVNLNKVQKSLRIYKYDSVFKVFDFFKDFINFTFLRKQNLTNSSNFILSVRIFKKKKN